MNMRLKTDFIVIHASDTFATMDIGAEDIRRWHKEERGWRDIGYAEVIRRSGALEEGRNLDDAVPSPNEVGAHAFGFNGRSVGICLVGGKGKDGKPENNFTQEQFKTLRRVLVFYKILFPNALIVGHNDLNSNKACPCFDVKAWLNHEKLQ